MNQKIKAVLNKTMLNNANRMHSEHLKSKTIGLNSVERKVQREVMMNKNTIDFVYSLTERLVQFIYISIYLYHYILISLYTYITIYLYLYIII
jgi:hypothetical protein